MAGAGFLEALGLVGYGPLESVVLAGLATETPVLLVGPHGTAKSLLVERLAAALGQSFRHYNTSLLNYDDLVGIPLPDKEGKTLRFVGTPGAIWGAGFAFFDEISRCRPDVQNKLFPVIHERRVAGVELPDLRLRWAAMNPPASDDDLDGAGSAYLGSESLDPALADRFGFVVRVPDWGDLSADDRRRLVSAQETAAGRKRPSLKRLASRCRRLAGETFVQNDTLIADYVVQLVTLLGKADLAESPRRARMLGRNVAAVHAARLLLEGEEAALEDSAELAVLHGLPQNASEAAPSPTTVIASHRQAFELAVRSRDDLWRQVLEKEDPARRVVLAEKLGMPDAELSRLVTQTLSKEECPARRLSLATTSFLGLRSRRALEPSAFEALAHVARRALEPAEREERVSMGRDLETWREINRWLSGQSVNAPMTTLKRNFLHAGFPELWRDVPWREAVKEFQWDLETFGVEGGA
jgi:MoxR-like ATPase